MLVLFRFCCWLILLVVFGVLRCDVLVVWVCLFTCWAGLLVANVLCLLFVVVAC